MKELIFGDSRDLRQVLKEIFGGVSTSGSPTVEACGWANSQLKTARIDPVSDPMGAVRFLRRQEPRLRLKPAMYLVKHLGR